MKVVMSGKFVLEYCEIILGVVEVCEVFYLSKFGVVVGCMVFEGMLYCNKLICIFCDDVVVF